MTETRKLCTSAMMTETSGVARNSASAVVSFSRSCIAVRPAAWMSCSSGSEILPSGRTGTVRDNASFCHTETVSTSPGPIT